MENRIVTRSLRSQLNQVILHEQVENGTTINNNLSANQVDQQFVTPRRVSWFEQKHLWTKERPIGHKTPQIAPIIFHEV
jgi:hypothetical protein